MRQSSLWQHVRRLAGTGGSETDAELLKRFRRHGDGAAFAALVARHGPMVLGVCHRLLGNQHDAEDAYQATWLVLARKAGSVRRPAALAGWLYGVAYRVARKAGRSSAGRRRREMLADAPEPADGRPDPLATLTARDLLQAVEAEVHRLPDRYRLPIALCCLQGLSQEEAARLLGCGAGSLKGRLERGRAKLQSRLQRRGLTLAAGLAAAEVARGGGPVRWAAQSLMVRGSTRAGGPPELMRVTDRARQWSEGVLRMILFRRIAAGAVVAAALVAVLAGWPTRPDAAAEPPAKNEPAPEGPRFWAGISVNAPLFQEGETERLQIHFTLVNDSEQAADPKVGSSRIVVNGDPLKDSDFILNNGPRDGRFENLPAGDHIQFAYALGNRFAKPGIYRVHWEGDRFRTAPVVFRVLAKRPQTRVPADLTPEKALNEAGQALAGLAKAVRADPSLRPKESAAPAVKAETNEGRQEVSLHYATTDSWPDLPSKPQGKVKGDGVVTVRIVHGVARTKLDAPFMPPARCFCELSVYGTTVPGVHVSLWSMTADPAAHARLEKQVRTELRAHGIAMDAKPLADPVRLGRPDPPPGQPALASPPLPPPARP